MRLSEAITIYLAVGASFGVYNLLREQKPGSRFHLFLKTIRAAILWPLAASKILFSRRSPGRGKQSSEAEKARAQFSEKINQAHSDLLASLHSVSCLTQVSSDEESAKVERASCVVREFVE
ncbi:MAG TPA: hypothetical protein VF766_08595, partial [Pyrinomonadaceae bacterium]